MTGDADTAFEKQVLADILEQTEDEAVSVRRQVRMRRMIMGTGSLLLLTAFILAMNSVIHPFGSAVLATVAGVAIGYALLLQSLERQWPITIRYVDVEAVQKRLDELDAAED